MGSAVHNRSAGGLAGVQTGRHLWRSASPWARATTTVSSSFLAAFAATRAVRVLQVKGRLPLGQGLTIGRRHIHHYVWGVLAVLAQGALAIGSDIPVQDLRRAVPLGAGLALVLDEVDILLGGERWRWAQEGRPYVDAGTAAAAVLALLGGGLRPVVRIARGRRRA